MGGNQSKQILLTKEECKAILKEDYEGMEIFFKKKSLQGMIPINWIFYNIIGKDAPTWIREVIFETIGLIEGKSYFTFEVTFI